MIHVSVKVNCTACSALERPPVVYHALGYVPVTWRCERTRAKLRRFPLAFCATAAVHRAACWQRQKQAVLWVNRQALHLHGLELKFRLGSQVKMFGLIIQAILQNCWAIGHYWWSCKEGAKNQCNKRLLQAKIEVRHRQQSQVANLSNFHILPAILIPMFCRLQPHFPYF